MWSDIGAAAIYGAIGGGVGALIGALFASFFRKTKFAQIATTVLSVTFVIIGYNVSEPLLKPYIGEYLPKSSAEKEFDEQFELALAELNKVPAFAAILEREPALRDELRKRIEKVAETAPSAASARLSIYTTTRSLTESRLNHYIARAQGADLVEFVDNAIELANSLLVRDPGFCYDFNYNPGAMSSFNSIEALRDKMGPDLFDKTQATNARLVRNAYDDIPEYDVNLANSEIQVANKRMLALLGAEKLKYITGAQIANLEADKRLACEATIALFEDIRSLDDPALVIRHIYAGL